jgi:hypothetical protein
MWHAFSVLGEKKRGDSRKRKVPVVWLPQKNKLHAAAMLFRLSSYRYTVKLSLAHGP